MAFVEIQCFSLFCQLYFTISQNYFMHFSPSIYNILFSLFCQLYFTISQNYFIFTSLGHLIEIGNSFEK
jgi:hypothetical protein